MILTFSGSPQPYRSTIATPTQSHTVFPPEQPAIYNSRSPAPNSWSPAHGSFGCKSPALFSPIGREENNEESEAIANQVFFKSEYFKFP